MSIGSAFTSDDRLRTERCESNVGKVLDAVRYCDGESSDVGGDDRGELTALLDRLRKSLGGGVKMRPVGGVEAEAVIKEDDPFSGVCARDLVLPGIFLFDESESE